jgi:hypothetical protein
VLETLTTIVTTILAALGGVVGIGAIALVFFKIFGEKWLSAKFEERLSEYKHAQQKELEHLRYEINALMDRTIKLHQHEFDVLPEAWGKLNDAFGLAQACVSPLQTYPDLNKMSEAHLEEFLSKSALPEWDKDQLRAAEDRTEYYAKRLDWRRQSEAEEACRKHHIYLKKSGIFIPSEVRDKFYELDALMWDALLARTSSQQGGRANPAYERENRCIQKPRHRAAEWFGACSAAKALESSILVRSAIELGRILIDRPAMSAFGQTGHRAEIAE